MRAIRTRERRSQHPMGIIAVACAFLAWASVLLVVLLPYPGGWTMGRDLPRFRVFGGGEVFVGALIIYASAVAAVAFGLLGTALGVLAQLRISPGTSGRYRWATIASLGALAAIVTLRMILWPSPL